MAKEALLCSKPICRLCMTGDTILLSIFDNNEVSRRGFVPLATRIMKCAEVKVSEQDGLPDQVCVNCAYHVDKYLEFKEQCQASDWKLRQRMAAVDQEQEIVVIKEEADLKDAHCLTSYRRPRRPMFSRTSDADVPTPQDVPSLRSLNHDESKLFCQTDDVSRLSSRHRDFLTSVDVGVCPDDQPDYKELSDTESNASTVVVGNLNVALHQDLDEAATLVQDFPPEQKHPLHLISFPPWTHEDSKPDMSGENSDIINADASAQSIQGTASIRINEEQVLGTPITIYKEKLESELHTDYVVQDNAHMNSYFTPPEGEEASKVINREDSVSTKEIDAVRYHQYKTSIDKVLEMLEDSSPSILSLADRPILDEHDSKEDLMISLKNLRKPLSRDNPTRTKHSNNQESQNSWDTCEESLETIYNYVNEGEKWPLNVSQSESLNENIILANLSHTNNSGSQDKKLNITDGSYKNRYKHVHSDIGSSSDSKTDVRQIDNVTAIFSVAIPLPLSKTAMQLSESQTTQGAMMAGDYRYGKKTRATQTTCKRKSSAENTKRASRKRKKLALDLTPIAPETNFIRACKTVKTQTNFRNISKLAKTCNVINPSLRMTNNSLNTSEMESDAKIWFNIESLYYDPMKHKCSSSAGELRSVHNSSGASSKSKSSNSPEVINSKENGNDARQLIENTILPPTKSGDIYRKNSKKSKKLTDNMPTNKKLKKRNFLKDIAKNKEVFENTKDQLNESKRESDDIVVESLVHGTETKDKDVLICNKLSELMLELTNSSEIRTLNKPAEIMSAQKTMSTEQNIKDNQSGGKSLTERRTSTEGKITDKESKIERRTSTEGKITDKESKIERRTSIYLGTSIVECGKPSRKDSKVRMTDSNVKMTDSNYLHRCLVTVLNNEPETSNHNLFQSKTNTATSDPNSFIGHTPTGNHDESHILEHAQLDKIDSNNVNVDSILTNVSSLSTTIKSSMINDSLVNNAISDIMNTSNVLNKTSNFNSIISSTHLKSTSSDDTVVCAASQEDNSSSSATTVVQHPETKLTKYKSADLDKNDSDRNSPKTLFVLKSIYKCSPSNVQSTETKPVKYAGSYVENMTSKSKNSPETNQKQDNSNHLINSVNIGAEGNFRKAKQSRWNDASSPVSAFDDDSIGYSFKDSYGYDYKESNNYDYTYHSDIYDHETGYRDNSRLSLERVDYLDENATYDLINYEDNDVNNGLIPCEFTRDDKHWFRYSSDRVPYTYEHSFYQSKNTEYSFSYNDYDPYQTSDVDFLADAHPQYQHQTEPSSLRYSFTKGIRWAQMHTNYFFSMKRKASPNRCKGLTLKGSFFKDPHIFKKKIRKYQLFKAFHFAAHFYLLTNRDTCRTSIIPNDRLF